MLSLGRRGLPKAGTTAIPLDCRESNATSDMLIPPKATRIVDHRRVVVISLVGTLGSAPSESSNLISPRSRNSRRLSIRAIVAVLLASVGST
jgi:hypothetical protein